MTFLAVSLFRDFVLKILFLFRFTRVGFYTKWKLSPPHHSLVPSILSYFIVTGNQRLSQRIHQTNIRAVFENTILRPPIGIDTP